MNYGRSQNSHVTMIDELPELEDLEGVGDHHVQMNRQAMERPGVNDLKYQKYIRNPQRINPQAGMESYGPPPMMQQQEMMMQDNAPPPRMQVQEVMNPPHNCIDIARHIESCPICSKFYQNDKTVYIIAIVILSIVCLLLLKRVLNV